ncbi:putative membrane protein [Actinomadura pelletieri DSM 43383]|uniref:Putative membrane protein n=1 Tax=Actinomadura pelletieri DSM 43383 TaxID=1120940 RepID=A0A495QZH6_9ACTN|nr:EamA family transporter [Actinomadura pelletieri]RKS79448.1 putative membrane protein [Actinomadura pelletieri DSM 43383]
MIAIVLALGAALGWGASDFLGGLKSRAAPLLTVLLISQSAALVLVTVLVTVRGAGPPGMGSLGQAAASGLAETVGVAALYRGLAVGRMSVVAPIAATAPVVPLLAGLATGEVPGTIQFGGLALALLGLVITSRRAGGEQDATSRALPSVLYGLLAALGFGAFFFAMDGASKGDVGWALLTARLTATAAVATVVVLSRHRVAVSRTDLPAVASIGVLIVTADTLYATASTHGLVSVVAVLGSLHTVVTMVLARVFLKERLARPQHVGIATSLLGVLTISAA